MNGYLLDTNVLSEVIKRDPSTRVLAQLRQISKQALFTASICVMELRFGAMRVPHGERLWNRIYKEILPLVRVVPLGAVEAMRAGDIMAALEGQGKPIGTEDVVIAATALVHGLTVSTRNVRHLARVKGLSVESWW